jgi:hypothetical protein
MIYMELSDKATELVKQLRLSVIIFGYKTVWSPVDTEGKKIAKELTKAGYLQRVGSRIGRIINFFDRRKIYYELSDKICEY